MKSNIGIYSPQYKYLCNYQWRHASESRATDTTDNSGGHISQSKCNLQFGRESRVFTIFIAISRPRDGWYIDTWTLTYYGYTHAIIQEGSCKLQLQGRKSLTWSEDNLLSHNVFDIWISGLWNVLRIRWVLHITFEIRMNCPNAWIIMNDNPCWLYLYPEHEVYRSPCPQCPTLHSPDTTRQGQRWVSAAAAGTGARPPNLNMQLAYSQQNICQLGYKAAW